MSNGVNWRIGYDLKPEDVPEAFWEEVEKALDACLVFQIGLTNLDTGEIAKSPAELIDREKGVIRFGGWSRLRPDAPQGFIFEVYGQNERGELHHFCKSGFHQYDVAIQCVCIIAEKHGVVRELPGILEKDPEYIRPWSYEEFGNPLDREYFEYARAEGILRLLGIIGREDHYDKWRKEWTKNWNERHGWKYNPHRTIFEDREPLEESNDD